MKFPPEVESWAEAIAQQLNWPVQPSVPIPFQSPRLAYGRHAGPPSPTARHAAVLIFLFPEANGKWALPLELRPKKFAVHAGEVALPGGRCQPGEDSLSAAIREFREELGYEVPRESIVAELAPTYVFASNHFVRTFVATGSSKPTWSPDPGEVDQVLLMPIQKLAEQQGLKTMQIRKNLVQFSAPYIEIEGHPVWGTTLRILLQFAQSLDSNAKLPHVR